MRVYADRRSIKLHPASMLPSEKKVSKNPKKNT